jgi:hypothetical protein
MPKAQWSRRYHEFNASSSGRVADVGLPADGISVEDQVHECFIGIALLMEPAKIPT